MNSLSATPRLRALDIVPASILALLVAASLTTLFVDRATAELIGVLGMTAGYATAGILMFRRAKGLPSSEHRAWRAAATALMIATVGVVVVIALGENAPVFGPADVFFLSGYGAMVISLTHIARMDSGGHPRGLTMLDIGIGAVAATAIVWDVVLEDLVQIQVSTVARIGLSLYPILDIGIITGICLVAMRRSHYRFDIRLVLLAAAMLLQVVADLLYLRDGAQAGSFRDAQPQFWLFLLTAAAFVSAAIVVSHPARKKEFPDRDAPLWALVWPYMLALTLVPLHVMRVERLVQGTATAGDAAGERVILYALLLVGVLIVLRQWYAIRYNRIRVENQRRDLIASVSHELRTPLTAIVGFLQVIEDDPGSFSREEHDSMMNEITHQARHMSRTVTDLITLARDDGATLAIRAEEASLEEIVESASDEAFGVTYTHDVEEHILCGDEARLDQAIGHLLANARKYGGSRIHLRAGVKGGMVTVEVHDDGPGIPIKHLSAVWNQFDRGTRRLDSTNPGLGIGLAIVRAVAVAHGGTAEYRRSELLGGSCFSIVLPATTRTSAPSIRELTAR